MMELKLVGCALIFLTAVEVNIAARCGSYPFKYCADYCCGHYDEECCFFNTDTPSSKWNTGANIGGSIGGGVGLLLVIAVIVLIVKTCSKTGTRVQDIRPQPHAAVYVTAAGAGAASGRSGNVGPGFMHPNFIPLKY